MRGLIGDRLLRRFAGRILELSEVTAPPDAASDQAEVEAGKSEDRSIYTPPEHPDGTVHRLELKQKQQSSVSAPEPIR